MHPLGIRFNDCYFSEPTWFPNWKPPLQAGLFVVLSPDSNWAPKPFQPLYFGEFGNNTQEGFVTRDCGWMVKAAAKAPLLVAVLPMPFSTTAQRLALREELLRAYNPRSQSLGSEHTTEHQAASPRQRIGFLP